MQGDPQAMHPALGWQAPATGGFGKGLKWFVKPPTMSWSLWAAPAEPSLWLGWDDLQAAAAWSNPELHPSGVGGFCL